MLQQEPQFVDGQLTGEAKKETLKEIVDQFAQEYMITNPGATLEEAKKASIATVMQLLKTSKFAGLAGLLLDTPIPLAGNRKERRRQAAIQRKFKKSVTGQ